MPVNARVLAIDSDHWLHWMEKELVKAGHSLVLRATNMESALDLIRSGHPETSRIDVAIFGVVIPSTPGAAVMNGGSGIVAGPEIAAALRKRLPGLKIIDFSSLDFKEASYADFRVRPTVDNLAEAVTRV